MPSPEASLADMKRRIQSEVDRFRPRLTELAFKIHANPEIGFQEIKASAWLCAFLSENGFAVEKGICQLPTAFQATYGKGSPTIAILAEYDALPNVGHACGHNLIATIAMGAGIAARMAIDSYGGTLKVFGTPAEELGSGKAIMVERGGFKGVDIAIMAHPYTENMSGNETAALQILSVEYFGKEAHAGAHPEQGINALTALVQAYTSINALRPRLKFQGAVAGIITDGGKIGNIIPGHSAGTFVCRAETTAELEETKRMVLDCFKGAALATGTRLEYKWEQAMAAMRGNMVLSRLFAANSESLGRKINMITEKTRGSTDMGNVSEIVPSIQPMIAIAPSGTALHGPQFAIAAVSETGIQGMIDAAKGLAMTAADLLANRKLISEAKDEFKQTFAKNNNDTNEFTKE